MLRLRKHADRSEGRNPDGSWPLAGVSITLDKDGTAQMSTRLVMDGKAEGWITTTGDRSVSRHGGPVNNPADPRALHNFVHFDTVTIHTIDEGDITFEVTHQPDKYADYEAATDPDAVEPFEADDETPVTDEIYAAGATRVDYFYDLKRVEASR